MNAAALLALLATLATAIGSMRLWWLHAPRMETRYLLDYCRFTLGDAQLSHLAVPHRSGSALADHCFAGCGVRWPAAVSGDLWPLVATAVVCLVSLVLAASSGRESEDKVLRGAQIVSHWRWNWPLMFKKSERGFYIETE
jgi:hypothetical protein